MKRPTEAAFFLSFRFILKGETVEPIKFWKPKTGGTLRIPADAKMLMQFTKNMQTGELTPTYVNVGPGPGPAPSPSKPETSEEPSHE